MKSCSDFPGAPSCCRSCHEDADEYWPDYPLCQLMEGNEIVAEVCCTVAHWIKKQAKVRELEGGK